MFFPPPFKNFDFSFPNSILYLLAVFPVMFRRVVWSVRLLVTSATSSIHRSPIEFLCFRLSYFFQYPYLFHPLVSSIGRLLRCLLVLCCFFYLDWSCVSKGCSNCCCQVLVQFVCQLPGCSLAPLVHDIHYALEPCLVVCFCYVQESYVCIFFHQLILFYGLLDP